jgi:hypothetical protein
LVRVPLRSLSDVSLTYKRKRLKQTTKNTGSAGVIGTRKKATNRRVIGTRKKASNRGVKFTTCRTPKKSKN